MVSCTYFWYGKGGRNVLIYVVYFICQIASCTYFRYGKGGRQEELQALCILALNIVIGRVRQRI